MRGLIFACKEQPKCTLYQLRNRVLNRVKNRRKRNGEKRPSAREERKKNLRGRLPIEEQESTPMVKALRMGVGFLTLL